MSNKTKGNIPKFSPMDYLVSFLVFVISFCVVALHLGPQVGQIWAAAIGLITAPVILSIFRLMSLVGYYKSQTFDVLVNEELEAAIVKGKALTETTMSEVMKGISNKHKGDALESLVGECFGALGYTIYDQDDLSALGVLPKHGDQGADRIAVDPVTREAIMIQVKNYSGAVSNKAVQETIAAMAYYKKSFNFKLGMVITNSTFTSSARELAARSDIQLMDRAAFAVLLKNTKAARKAA